MKFNSSVNVETDICTSDQKRESLLPDLFFSGEKNQHVSIKKKVKTK